MVRALAAAAALMLAACAQPVDRSAAGEARARAAREADERDRARLAAMTEQQRSAEAAARVSAADRDAQAREICAARGQLREGSLPWRGVLNLDNVIAGSEASRICWDTYQRTGLMPTF